MFIWIRLCNSLNQPNPPIPIGFFVLLLCQEFSVQADGVAERRAEDAAVISSRTVIRTKRWRVRSTRGLVLEENTLELNFKEIVIHESALERW
jgi:hypothetical protein